MLPFIRPALDWEEANHMLGALGALVDMGLGVYNALRGEREEGEEDPEAGQPHIKMTSEDGEERVVSVPALVAEHEARLRALEAPPEPKKPRKRKKAAPRAAKPHPPALDR